MSTDYIDGFLRYDAFPQNSFAKRDLPVPRFGRSVEVRGGNSKLVKSIAWSCDGRRVATGTELKGLRIWEAQARSGSTNAVAVDAGHSVALPSSSKTPSPHNGHIAALAWSPTDPNLLVSGCCKGASGGGVVVVWDVTKPTAPLASIKIAGDVLHLAFHPSGQQFAAVCPRSTRDEVYFFRQEGETWVQRSDILMGGAGIDIGVEEMNSLRFWLGGDALMAVSNDGSLTSWWYPLEERPPLPEAPTKSAVDERLTKKNEVESPAAAPTPNGEAPEEEAEEREAPEDDEGREAAEAEDESEDKTNGNAEGDKANGEAENDDKANGEAEEGDKASGLEITVQGPDDDVEMTDVSAAPASAPATAAPSAAPSAPASAAPSRKGSRQPTPAEDKAEALAAANEAQLAEKRAQAAADLAKRKHKQLQLCYRKVPHVVGLLALAVDPLGRFFAIGGQDARVSLLSSEDWSVQRNFDAPTAAIRHAAFSPDGELLAVGGDDPCIFIFAVFARTTIAKVPITGSVNALAWCPTRNVLAYSTNSKTGIVWHLVSQE